MRNFLLAKANRICIILLVFCLCIAKTIAQPTLGYLKILSGLSVPVDIKNAGDSSRRIFIVQQSGEVRIVKGGQLLSKPFLNIANLVNYYHEQGLISIAFHPNYRNNGFFFVYYNNTKGNITLARYKVSKTNRDSADPSTRVILFSKPKPNNFNSHNGGTLQFGKDGYLYLSIGDGGGLGDPYRNAQNGQTFFGKILRLDINVNTPPYYAIPPTNPFVNDPNVLDEVYDLGLRNPWKWSFDRQTGDMWIGDVGEDSIEEVNYRKPNRAGSNFGWNCYEGTRTYKTDSCKSKSNYVFPIFSYHHDISSGGECVIGGYVYRGTKYPQLQGYYICADYIDFNIWKIIPNGSGGWNIYLQKRNPPHITSFGENEAGEIYVITRNGDLYRVIALNNFVEAAPGVTNTSVATFVYPTLVDNNTITVVLNDHYNFARIIDMNGHQVMKKRLVMQQEKFLCIFHH